MVGMARCGLAWLSRAIAGAAGPAGADWPATAPEQLPPVTVRWLDGGQAERFAVEGADYACRVATHPARLESLRVGDRELLPAGAVPAFVDAAGELWQPAPRELTPNWQVWQRKWVPASSSRARMNVWNAGPYYWDAHLLDIPFVKQSALAARRRLRRRRRWASTVSRPTRWGGRRCTTAPSPRPTRA